MSVCEQFRRNPTINPRTGRSIKVDGPTYRKLARECGLGKIGRPKQRRVIPVSPIQPIVEEPTVSLGAERALIPNKRGCVYSLVGRSGEDRYVSAVLNGDILMYAVLDGHGGSRVVNKAKQLIAYKIAQSLLNKNFEDETQIQSAVQEAFRQLDRELLSDWEQVLKEAEFPLKFSSGSTTTMVLLKGLTMYLVNLGDSRTIVFDEYGNIPISTRDHKPADEKERIEKVGGHVISPFFGGPSRVNGILAVSRALGDFNLKKIEGEYSPEGPVSAIPDVNKIILPSSRPNQPSGYYLLLGSDGLFDYVETEEVIREILEGGNPLEKCEQVTRSAHIRSTDDITAIIVEL